MKICKLQILALLFLSFTLSSCWDCAMFANTCSRCGCDYFAGKLTGKWIVDYYEVNTIDSTNAIREIKRDSIEFRITEDRCYIDNFRNTPKIRQDYGFKYLNNKTPNTWRMNSCDNFEIDNSFEIGRGKKWIIDNSNNNLVSILSHHNGIRYIMILKKI